MRVRLSNKSLEKIFGRVLGKFGNWRKIAESAKVSIRTLNDWRRGKATIPITIFEKFLNLTKLNSKDLSPTILNDFWHIREAARKGANAKMKLYGNLGTEDGRRRGGLTSIMIHRKLRNRFKTLKSINKPSKSETLAELLGIFIGDGHLSDYQAIVTTNSQTDRDHALYVQEVIKNLFDIVPKLRNKTGENAINVIASSRNLVKFLNNQGMPIGNKIKKGLFVPAWISRKKSYQKSFIRGLFDTDGCVYLDIHKVKNKLYKNIGWTITSASDKLVSDILRILKNLGFSPTHQKSQRSVYMRRKENIIRYFNEVGTNNPKHSKRYAKFIGGVPKRS